MAQQAGHSTRVAAAVVAALALVLAGGCGGDDEELRPAQPTPEPYRVDETKGPYEVTCDDVAHQQEAAGLTRRASVALANQAEIRGLTTLQATQSIFLAMTELCKEEAKGYKPAKAAVEAVRSGRYRANLGEP
jgi:hypothetical protein